MLRVILVSGCQFNLPFGVKVAIFPRAFSLTRFNAEQERKRERGRNPLYPPTYLAIPYMSYFIYFLLQDAQLIVSVKSQNVDRFFSLRVFMWSINDVCWKKETADFLNRQNISCYFHYTIGGSTFASKISLCFTVVIYVF